MAEQGPAIGRGIDIKELWREAKENQIKLASCTRHTFVASTRNPSKTLTTRYRCSKCGGDVSASNYHWYMAGLKHGAGFKKV